MERPTPLQLPPEAVPPSEALKVDTPVTFTMGARAHLPEGIVTTLDHPPHPRLQTIPSNFLAVWLKNVLLFNREFR